MSDEAKYAVNRRDNPGYVGRFLERPRFARPILVNLAQSFDSLGSHYPSDGVPQAARRTRFPPICPTAGSKLVT